jgi:endonuclease/exonuclease/phosphatase family metal-dependent hydrolase
MKAFTPAGSALRKGKTMMNMSDLSGCAASTLAPSTFMTRHSQILRIVAILRNIAFIVATLSFGFAVAAIADDGNIRILTQNMDEGTNFDELRAATSPGAFFAAVTTTYQNILATKPAERAATMAREIARERPDIVGLQEASILRTGPVSPATTVKSDLLQSLQDELEKLGEHYRIAAIIPGFDAEAPSTLGFDVRLTTQDAILVRREHLVGNFRQSNNQVQRYLVGQNVPTALGISFTLPRGWASFDVTVGGRTLRFVTTHLDTLAAVSLPQVRELIASAAGETTLPIVLSGDFNARADSASDPTYPTYKAVIDAGFTDAWLKAGVADQGFTCCQNANLNNATTALNQRIDLVMLRGISAVSDVRLVGNASSDKTPSGLWPSDHAGLAVTLRIPGAGGH